MKTYTKHPTSGEAAEVKRLVLTDNNATAKEILSLWSGGECLFAKEANVTKSGNVMKDIDGNDVTAWTLQGERPMCSYPWEAEIIPLHDETRWYVLVSVVITMKGVNITNSCYNPTTHKISIPLVKGDIVVTAEATEVIQWEEHKIGISQTFGTVPIATNNNDETEDSQASIGQINGNTFVWHQLFENASSSVATKSGAVYLKQIGGVRTVFTSAGETVSATTNTDMLINLTHLYGANARGIALTKAQFERLFPEDYYPYCAPKLLHMAITRVESEGVAGNDFVSAINLPITSFTGKLNGSGDSVNIFPNGMMGAVYSDYIYNEDGVWKAKVRTRQLTFNPNNYTWATSSGYPYISISTSAATKVMSANTSKLVVCDKLMSSTYNTVNSGYIGVGAGSSKLLVRFNSADKTAGLPTSLTIVYVLDDTANKIYVLDDEYQTLLNQTFRVCERGTLKAINSANDDASDVTPTSSAATIRITFKTKGLGVKNYCIGKWGGRYVNGELTAKEAADVEDIHPEDGGERYFNARKMHYFNEFKYFTGLKTISTSNSTSDGTFQNCQNLREIKLPKIASLSENFLNGSVFRSTRALSEVDLSPWGTTVGVNLYCMFYASSVVKVDLRPFKAIISAQYIFQSSSSNPSSLEELDTTGCTFGGNALSNGAFSNCNKLTTIKGGFSGHKGNINLGACPLTHDSAVEILESLGTANSGATITFKASTYNTLTSDEKAIGTGKGYSIASA